MANFVATARTNYFRVTDIQAFQDMLAAYGFENMVQVRQQSEEPDSPITLIAAGTGQDTGEFPGMDQLSMYYQLGLDSFEHETEDEDPEEFAERAREGLGNPPFFSVTNDFLDLVANYLAPEEVAIFITIGNEKMRYLVGMAEAINAQGERVLVSLNQIYEQARVLTKNPQAITEATY